jgi:hypothetical protein
MDAELKALHEASRIATSAKIRSAPEDYKVCWVCLSIAYQRAPLCPVCHAHRFYQSADAVRVVAGMMEQVAIPVTAGTVPRFIAQVREQPEDKEVENGN